MLLYVNGGGPTDSVSTDDSEYISLFLVAEVSADSGVLLEI